MEFSRPEYWSGQLFPSPGDLPKPGFQPRSSALQADSLPAKPQAKPIAKETKQNSLQSQVKYLQMTELTRSSSPKYTNS